MGDVLEFHSGIALNKVQSLCWVCSQPDSNDISMYAFRNASWVKQKDYPKNPYPLLQLACSHDENFVIGTFKTGFLLWNIKVLNRRNLEDIIGSDVDEGCMRYEITYSLVEFSLNSPRPQKLISI